MKVLCRKTALATSILAAASLTHPAEAQHGRRGILEEVVVTARRVEESLQAVPVAVTSISGEAITKSSIITSADLERQVPSLVFTSSPSRSNATPYVSIRGLRNADISITIDPAVAFYFDEIGQQRPNGVTQTLYDIESVQVLKGPQGTLFGRNTTGGAILINSKKPTDQLEGYLQVRGGNLSYKDAEGAANLPLGEGVALRLSGKVTKRDGFMKNRITGQETSDLDYYSYRARLKFDPTENFSSLFSGSVFKEDSNGTAYQTIEPAAGALAAIYGSPTADDPRSLQDDYAVSASDDYDYLSDVVAFSKTDVHDVSNISTLAVNDSFLGDITLKNIIGWRKVETHTQFDFDGTQFIAVWLDGHTTVKQWSEEFQVLGGNDRVEWIAGLYYFQEKGDDLNHIITFAPRDLPAVFTRELGFASPRLNLTGNEAKNKSYSAFGHVKYSLTDQLTLSAGLRWTQDKREAVDGGFGTNHVCRITDENGVVLPDDACFLEDSKTFDEPTYNISLDYQWTDDLLVYVAHRHGYRSGGFNNRAVNPLSFAPFDAETVDDIELGLKTDFALGDTQGRLNVAAYYAKYDDIQRTFSYVQPGTDVFVSNIVNAAKATMQGLEAELTLQFNEYVSLSAFYSYNDAEYDKWDEVDPNTPNEPPVDRSNNDFDYMPNHHVGANLRLDLPMVDPSAGRVSLLAGYYKQTSFELDIFNKTTVGSKQDGYDLLNLRADWEQVMGSNFDLALFANNVTDEVYSAGGVANPAIGIHAVQPGAPRTYGLELKYTFGEE